MLLFAEIFGREDSVNTNKEIPIDDNTIIEIGMSSKEAFEKLYYATDKVLYAYILSFLKNHEDTMDVLHDTYIKIRSAAHLYKPMNKPMAWVFTIARNLAKTKITQNKRNLYRDNTHIENDLSFSYVTDAEDRMVLITVLKELTEEERSIILLHAVSGLKHKEIAEVLNLPLSTVLSKYNRGLKKLKNKLEKKGVRYE